jgi:DNA polymerase-3 subunit delta'
MYLPNVPLLPIYGHRAVRERIRDMVARGTLPSSLLLQGPRGVGKQQLALWLGRMLLCEDEDVAKRPCGKCRACRMTAEVQHPDLQWFFPRERLKKNPDDIDDIREDMAGAIRDRMENDGVYEGSAGDQGIFVATIRALVQTATMSPAMAKRKVLIVADAEQMVVQEGSDQAANAFLKLLEEPPADTTIILTSSEAGALLPTIRSRVIALRVAPLTDDEVRAFLTDPAVEKHIDLGADSAEEILRLAGGAPGRLVSREAWRGAIAQAEKILEAAASPDRGPKMRVALSQGVAGARGKYSDTLDALTFLLHERTKRASMRGDNDAALAASKSIQAVEDAKEHAYHNVNPQLLTASLLRRIAAGR